MNIHQAYLLAALTLSFAQDCRCESAMRTFSTPDGRSLEARVLEHNENNGKIKLERADGRKIWTLPSVFAQADQAYIRQWIIAHQFMSSIKFKIKGDSDKDSELFFEKAGDGSKVRSEETTDIAYMITLQNRSGFTFPDLKVEYRAFIHTKGYEGKKDSDRVEGEILDVGDIGSGEEVTKTIITHLVTDYVTVAQASESSYGSYSYTYYGKKTYEDDLKGFWVRVYGPSIDGQPAVREWCYPSDTIDDFKWSHTTGTKVNDRSIRRRE
jgi:hypothetical protein